MCDKSPHYSSMNHKLIVIDTNVLLSAALSPNGTARKALDKAYKKFKIA